ncbi:hypothetical protein IFM51744_08916 [Aspergillus udagawae]|nr:hypothetical protein IFM51744_08916 [Aspergillus udagawae]
MLEGLPVITSPTADSQDQSENNTLNIRAQEKSTRKLRAACDGCHAAKTRCTGGTPCARCYRDNLRCHYSYKAKLGKPKGSMNKKTIERLRRMREAQERDIRKSQGAAPTPPAISSTSAAGSSSDARPDILQLPSELGEFSVQIRSSEPTFEAFFLPDECLLELENHWPSAAAESPSRTDQDNAQLPLNDMTPQVENANTKQDARLTLDNIFCLEDGRHETSPRPSTTPSESSLASLPSDPQLLPVHQEVKTRGITHSTLLTSRVYDNSVCGITSCAHSPCACFSTATNHLCNLRTTPRSAEQFRSIDTLLIHSRRMLPSIRHLLKCRSCTADTQALFLAKMVLSRLLEWSRSSLSAYGVCAEVRLGRYHASGEFGAIVATMIIQKHLGEIKKTVEEFKKKVDEMPQGNSDAAYLTLQVKGFEIELDGLVGRISNDSAVSAH